MPTRVLIVDDEPGITAALMVRLQANGYDVCHAINGLAGLQAARAEQPDAIILDIRMPDIDGTEVNRRLKDDPALAAIPVIYLSANVPAEAREHGFELDGSFFLSKPYEASDVIRAIDLVVGRRRAASSNARGAATCTMNTATRHVS